MKLFLNPDGSAQINNFDEGKLNPDGSPAQDNWGCAPDQLGKLIASMPTPKKVPVVGGEDHPWSNLSAGDKTAARDAAAQYADAVRALEANS